MSVHHHTHALDAASLERPKRSPAAVDVDLDGHRLIYDTADGAVRLLDPVGSVIWNVLDGSASVEELSDDLSAAFAVPRDQLAADVDRFVHQLGYSGLLDRNREAPDLSRQRITLPNPPSP